MKPIVALSMSVIVVAFAVAAYADVTPTSDPGRYEREVSRRRAEGIRPSHFPTEGVEVPVPLGGGTPTAWGMEVRNIEGFGNNLSNSSWGAASSRFIRLVPAAYEDEMNMPSGSGRPNPRTISNIVFSQLAPASNRFGATDFVWQWGQFLDHDISMTPALEDYQPMDIPVPMGDPYFDPSATGTVMIQFDRSLFDHSTGGSPSVPRQQMNAITAFIDASNVYGSDPSRAFWLRTDDGTGRLKTSSGNNLPYNTLGLSNAGGTSPSLFLAGDVRANEQCGLTAMHTLFVREHNRLVAEMAAADPGLTGEELYQRAKAIVGAQMQVITYEEFLPTLLGPNALTPYTGYKPAINPGLSNIFASAAYRLGHSMLSSEIQRMVPHAELEGKVVPYWQGHLPLREAFFAPWRITAEGGIEPLLRGLAAGRMQDIDIFMVDETRNFLFGPPGAEGLDLAALNIQRGRDHGLPSYNQVRMGLGLSPAASFGDISPDPVTAGKLQLAYGDVNLVDFWVGGLAEPHVEGAAVGESIFFIMKDQFERLRDGDRFFYLSHFTFDFGLLSEIHATRLSDIIRRNTGIGDELQDNAFVVAGNVAIPTSSSWTVVVLSLLLIVVGTLLCSRPGARRAA